ncbi:hypothetical protein GCM10009133_02110 [Cocleimonas flava]|uniref:Uncharacterized protein DUF1996 n=1 Tax=Cocleimonas flava TaxID=634765 RepID=A0A4R1EYT6_9GAMM|nr:DUF1996 domain-containing protein [Cocleimonas flava]TCJ85184.1 uncharacterized protein DUF1996 [Cocleimonas flava]
MYQKRNTLIMVFSAVALIACGGGGSKSEEQTQQTGDDSGSSVSTTTPTTPATTIPDTPTTPATSEPRVIENLGAVSNEILDEYNGYQGSAAAGESRFVCHPVRIETVDPILNPGAISNHEHIFWGNAATNRNSTYDSLINEPAGASCSGGAINKSAYWMPTLLDPEGNPVIPDVIFNYYKTGYQGQDASAIISMPAGLQMISSQNPNYFDGAFTNWSTGPDFQGGDNEQRYLPDEAPQWLRATVGFPQCWNGVELTSANGKDHVAHHNGGQCPSTHPVLLPELTISASWEIGGSLEGYQLSSDAANGAQPGELLHADFMDAWDPAWMDLIVTRCLNAEIDCGTRQIGQFGLIDPSF